MDREELERFKRKRRSSSGGREKIGLQRIAFELMHLEEAKLTQEEKEVIAAAKDERDRMSPSGAAAIQDYLMRDYSVRDYSDSDF